MSNFHSVLTRLAKSPMSGRRLVLVDVENVVGGAVLTCAAGKWARAVVEAAVGVSQEEHVIIGTSHLGLFSSRAAWPSARLRVRSGESGADLELLDVMINERIEDRFDELVLISGDGIFAPEVSRLAGTSMLVTVASWRTSLSSRLRLAGNGTIYLDDSALQIRSKVSA